MPFDEEVISCPVCRHALRVPVEWLGSEVQCPECRSIFRAPQRGADGRLGEGQLLTAEAVTPSRPRGPDWLLMLPAFGLIVLGGLSLFLNAMTILNPADPAAKKQAYVEFFQKAREKGYLDDGPTDADPDKQKQLRKQFDEERAETALKYETPVAVTCAILAALTLAGGMAIVMRRYFLLAVLGSVAAFLNISVCCCLPGAILGTWTLFLLFTGGRDHFQ